MTQYLNSTINKYDTIYRFTIQLLIQYSKITFNVLLSIYLSIYLTITDTI